MQHEKISKAKSRLVLKHPFFATLLLRTEIVVTDKTASGQPIELAATDGSHIYYSPKFLDECSVEDVMTVLAHEVGHDSLLHSLRLGGRDPEVFNQAADHAINIVLEDQGFSCPKKLAGGWLCDPEYKGWSADRIYDDLRRNPEKQAGGSDTGGKDGKDPLHGDLLPHAGASGDPAQQAAAEQKARQRVAAAATAARMAGKMSGELARMVDDLLETKVLWTDVLRDYMLRIVKGRDSWARRNRRFQTVYLPTRHEQRMGPIVFIPDTSGSMWGDDMAKICSEMAHCAEQTSPENITVLWADTKVAGTQVFTPAEFEFDKLEPKGGGGTDMRVPLAHAETLDPQVVVLLTDGYTPWPDAPPPYPTIVICTTDTSCPDWAEVIKI